MNEAVDLAAEWSRMIRDPRLFVRQAFGIKPDRWQDEVLRDIADPSVHRVAVKSCHGPGKTTVAAWAILWWILRYYYPKIPCTAPTEHQLFDNLWPEIHKWIRRSSWGLESVVKWSKTRVQMMTPEGPDPEWFAVGRVSRVSRSSTSDQGEAYGLQGFHSEHLLFVVDEASGVLDPVYASIEGGLATGQSKILAIGNPNIPSGWFHRAFHKDRAEWSLHTVGYQRSSRVNRAWAESMVRRYGEDHPWVRVRVFGEFPLSAEAGLVGLWAWERQSLPSEHKRLSEIGGKRTLGVDVARYGSNSSVIAYATGPVCHRIEVHPQTSNLELAALIKRAISVHEPELIVIDADGIGAGVVDVLVGLGVPNLVAWHEGGAARDGKQFVNARAELGWKFREAIHAGEIAVPDNEDAGSQAVGMKYVIRPDGKIKLESKEDLSKRMDSPDEFDAIRYALVPYLIGPGDLSGAVVPIIGSMKSVIPVSLLIG